MPQNELDRQAAIRETYDWGGAVERVDRLVLVAESDGLISGIVECVHLPAPGRLPSVEMLYVVPSAWGIGTAKALLDAALSAVWAAGHRTAWLEVVERYRPVTV